MIYVGTVLPQFLYCASAWYQPKGGMFHGYHRQKYLKFLKQMQKRAAVRISGAFRTSGADELDVELDLLPVELQLEKSLDIYLPDPNRRGACLGIHHLISRHLWPSLLNCLLQRQPPTEAGLPLQDQIGHLHHKLGAHCPRGLAPLVKVTGAIHRAHGQRSYHLPRQSHRLRP